MKHAQDTFHLPIGNDFSRLLVREKGYVTFDGSRRLACVSQRISADSVTITTTIRTVAGSNLTLEFERFGCFRGKVTRTIGGLIMIDLLMDDAIRRKLRQKISWLEKKRVLDLRERRRFERWAPAAPISTIMASDGSVRPVFVMDVSSGGAAIATSDAPRLGEVVALGRLVGRVVRHIEDGFTLQFNKPVQADEVEKHIEPLDLPAGCQVHL